MEKTYEQGYNDAARELHQVLEKMILRAENSDDLSIEIMGLVIGQTVLFNGGTSDEAIDAVNLMRDLGGLL